MCSSIAKSCSLRRPQPVSGTSRMSDWDSRPPRKLSKPNMLTRNVPSQVTSRLEAKSWRVLSFPPRCRGRLWWGEITCTTCQNIIVMRKDTETFQFIARQRFPWRKEILWWLDNADLWQRLFISTYSKSSLTRLWAMSGNSSCSFDWLPYLY